MESPIFIVGTGRSGTSLLRQMLNAHPRIYLTHEASFFSFIRELSRLAKTNPEKWTRIYSASLAFAWLQLPKSPLIELARKSTRHEALKNVMNAVMQDKAKQFGKVRFGDKTPFHIFNLKEIFEFYPSAKVIHIVRDPRATTFSLNQMPWFASSRTSAAMFCNIDANLAKPFQDRIFTLRLEDLLENPESSMRNTLDFVEEEWSDSVLQHWEHCPKNDMPPFPWLKDAGSAPSVRPEKWPQRLSPAEIRVIEYFSQTAMKKFDYKPAELETEPSRFEQAAFVLRELPDVIASIFRIRWAMRAYHMKRVPPMAELVKRFNTINKISRQESLPWMDSVLDYLREVKDTDSSS